MKAQIYNLKLENESLKQKLQDGNHHTLELLSEMAGLSVCCTSQSSTITTFSCNVLDGNLKGNISSQAPLSNKTVYYFHAGHSFILTVDQCTKECCYNPEGSPLTNLCQLTKHLAQEIVFSKYMLTRFLMNLLTC